MSLPPYPGDPSQGGAGQPQIPPVPAYAQSQPTQLQPPQQFALPPQPPKASGPGMTWWQGLMVGVAALLAIALPASGVAIYAGNARLISDRQAVASFTPADNISALEIGRAHV